ncbi:MAG: hypothetical protein ACYC7D_08395 [Nitrososphaerales archaeon]
MEKDQSFIGLITIFAIAWLLVLLGAIVIFEFIIPFEFCSCFYDGILKGLLTSILAVAWLVAMITMRNSIVRKRILQRKIAK